MNEPAAVTPRWGNEGRDRKAMAILRTMVYQCGERVTEGTWLDIGCGSGGIASALAPHVRTVVGIDPEPWSIWSELSAAQKNLSFVAASCDERGLPVPEKSADIIICNQVYEHVSTPRQLIENLYRVLKPGGICYFAGPNLLWPIEPHVNWPFVHWLPRRAAQRGMTMLGSGQAAELDAYSHSCWRLQRWFVEAGFEWEDIVPIRLSVELRQRGHRQLARLLDAVPAPWWKPVKPLWPGFVFILRKQGGAAGSA